MAVDLDLSSLDAAIARLSEGLDALARQPDERLFRDAVIKRFEITYELCHKMLRRYLLLASADPEQIQALSFPDLIRTGSEHGLLRSDWESWIAWREARARTSHTYNEDVAADVAARIPEFLEEARYLLRQLKDRIA